MVHPASRGERPIVVRSSQQHISDATNNEHKWGRAKTFNAPWSLGAVKTMLMLGDITRQNERRVPQVQNLVLALRSMQGSFPASENAVFRWQIGLGAGGALTKFVVDAASLLQLSVSAETLEIGLLCDSWGPNWPIEFEAPDFSVQGAAFFADGTTATESPTYTQRWQIPAGETSVRLVAPYGATAFRILGQPSALGATGPFVADMLYTLEPTAGGEPLDQFEGVYLEDIRIADIPFPATPAAVLVANTSGDGLARTGGVAWSIAL